MLNEEWEEACNALKIDRVVSTKWFAEVQRLYAEETRFYHNFTHVNNMLTQLRDHFADAFIDKCAVVMSVYFHDVIYNPKSKTNEEDSALKWEAFAKEADLEDKTFVSKVSDYILQTKQHHQFTGDDLDEKRFLDLDLSILAADTVDYEQYVENIRKEYAHIEDDAFRTGRSKVLQTFIDAEHLFYTDTYRGMEAKAKANLEAELKKLNS